MLSAIPGFRWVDWNWNLHQGGEREREISCSILCMWSTKFFQICTNYFLSQQTLLWQKLDYQIEIAKRMESSLSTKLKLQKRMKSSLSTKLKLQKRMESCLSTKLKLQKNVKFSLSTKLKLQKEWKVPSLYQIEIAKKNGKFPLSTKLKLQKRMESSLSLPN
jgi:hypothetical protein